MNAPDTTSGFEPDGPILLAGFGVTNQAVARAVRARGGEIVIGDDRATDHTVETARELGVTVSVAPDWDTLIAGAGALMPTPGLPETHRVIAAARQAGVPILSEFDLAAAWDHRPTVMITATNGKTTVTTLTRNMLRRSGIDAEAVGNTETPLIAAIDDQSTDVFVVEASSFRLAWSRTVAPTVGVWLNVAPDHLDVHSSVATYVAAKERIWENVGRGTTAVAVYDDPDVRRRADRLPTEDLIWVTASDRSAVPAGGAAVAGRSGDVIVTADDEQIARVADLWSGLPHDISNVAAAASAAARVGATPEGIRAAVAEFGGLAHRVQFVARVDGVSWYDDSKSTAPHSTLAAVRGFPSVILLAGGRNKGLDLSELAAHGGHIRHIVGFGEAGGEAAAAVAEHTVVADLPSAVAAAARVARPGDTVLLSPACASFDQYNGYSERGDHFVALVNELAERAGRGGVSA